MHGIQETLNQIDRQSSPRDRWPLSLVLMALLISALGCMDFINGLSVGIIPGGGTGGSSGGEFKILADIEVDEAVAEGPKLLVKLKEMDQVLDAKGWAPQDPLEAELDHAIEQMQFAVDNYGDVNVINDGGYISRYNHSVETFYKAAGLAKGADMANELRAQVNNVNYPGNEALVAEVNQTADNLDHWLDQYGNYPLNHEANTQALSANYRKGVDLIGQMNDIQADAGFPFPNTYPGWNSTFWDFSS